MKISNGVNKKIPFPIAIIIIIACAVLVGLIVWYYRLIPEVSQTIPSLTQEKLEEKVRTKGVLIEFGGSSFVRAPHTEVQLYITVAHSCKVPDELILQKVEICREDGKAVKSFEVNKRLEVIGKEIEEVESLKRELGITEELKEYPSDPRFWTLVPLLEKMRKESFQTGYFEIDLREFNESLGIGDQIPIIAKVSVIHNGSPVVLMKTFTVELRSPMPRI